MPKNPFVSNTMCDYESSGEIKNSGTYRSENSLNCYPRQQGNVPRPPFPMLRRRMMSNMYPTRGSKTFMRLRFRPNFPGSRRMPNNYRYHQPATNQSLHIFPNTFNRASLPNVPATVNNNKISQGSSSRRAAFHNVASINNNDENILYSSSPDTIKDRQESVESSDCPREVDSNISDLWVEALAPSGQKYFYNARTRDTAWETPLNAQIIHLDEMKRLPILEQIQNSPLGQDLFPRTTTNVPYVNSFYPVSRNFATSSELLVFPPPSTICNPLPLLTTSTNSVYNTTNVKFDVTVPPPALPFSIVVGSSVSKVNDCVQSEDSFKRMHEQPPPKFSSKDFVDTKQLSSNKSKILDWSISNSKTSLSSIDAMKSVSENINVVAKMGDNELRDSKFGDKISNTNNDAFQSQNNFSAEKAKEYTNLTKNEGRIDKSRPVSSTPVPESSWCVVWTGDERVFYYDCMKKISVWERPEELIHRLDVDKLIEKPVILIPEKLENLSSKTLAKTSIKDDKNEADSLN